MKNPLIGKSLFRVYKHSVVPVMVLLSLLLTNNIYACSRDITKLKPEIRRKLNELRSKAEAEGIDYKIICGYRSQEAQDKLYSQGRSTPGKKVTWTKRSRHTAGIAFDVAVLKEYRISWRPKDYFRIGQIGKSIGLTWGGDWKVRDYGHFELTAK